MRLALALAGLTVAALVIAGVVIARGGGRDTSAPYECALAWNRTASAEERDLLNKDAQVARGPDSERRVHILLTTHAGEDERFTQLDGEPGVARVGTCLVIGKLGMTFVRRESSRGWMVTQAQSFGPLSAHFRRVLSGESNAYVEAPIAGLEEPTPRDGLILGVDGADVR